MSVETHRDYDGSRTCGGCRFWSELMAQAIGDGPLEALCINARSPKHMQFTCRGDTCDAWKSGHLGAIDDPAEDHLRYMVDTEGGTKD